MWHRVKYVKYARLNKAKSIVDTVVEVESGLRLYCLGTYGKGIYDSNTQFREEKRREEKVETSKCELLSSG